ncbi:MAG: hypothetical protein FGF53_07300 [Candidatus Brockarchaeota archaeon]|nr:hypothetical protein [Candidatus Brockarchaeota archaeon]MBO3810185.1 hypothetical protein [Candidatus Brockarchaeota archaeon]
MTMRVKTCLTFLLTMLFNTCLNTCANPSTTVWGNETHVSMRVTAFLCNRTLVELCLTNNVSLTVFRPESFNTLAQDSTLLVEYDARFSGSPPGGAIIEDTGGFSQKHQATCLQTIVFFTAGLILLVLNIIGFRKSEKELLKNMENGFTPPKGSRLSEEALLLLASRNPDAYRRVLEMVLKGELKVEKTGWMGKVLARVRRLFRQQ